MCTVISVRDYCDALDEYNQHERDIVASGDLFKPDPIGQEQCLLYCDLEDDELKDLIDVDLDFDY